MTAAALDDTDPRSKIPDTGALDRCRDDEENRAGGIAAIGAQLQSGQAQRDARGGWQRAEADRVEKPALPLAQRVGLVQSLGERVEALLHGEALAEYFQLFCQQVGFMRAPSRECRISHPAASGQKTPGASASGTLADRALYAAASPWGVISRVCLSRACCRVEKLSSRLPVLRSAILFASLR